MDGGFILFRLVVFHCAFLRNHFCFTKEEGNGGGFHCMYHCFFVSLFYEFYLVTY